MKRQRLIAFVCIGALGCGGGSPSVPAPVPTPPPTGGIPGQPAASVDLHQMDTAKHTIPDAPASGRLQGRPFNPDRVELEGNKLTFRQGKDFFPDLEIVVLLNASMGKET